MISEPPPNHKNRASPPFAGPAAKARAEPIQDRPVEVSIVVVHYQTEKQSRLCLRSLRKYTELPHELVVVNNSPEHSSSRYLESLPWIRLIVNNDPEQSHRRGLQRGLEAATGEWILALHSDCFVKTKGWLQRLLALKQPGALMMASCDRVIMPLRGPWDRLHLWWTRRKQRKRWQARSQPPKLITHCALFHRSLFEQHGQRFDTPKHVDGQFIDCAEAIQRYCEAKDLPVQWLGREQLAPLLWHFEAATLNLVTGRKLALKRRLRTWWFYQRTEIKCLLSDDGWDR